MTEAKATVPDQIYVHLHNPRELRGSSSTGPSGHHRCDPEKWKCHCTPPGVNQPKKPTRKGWRNQHAISCGGIGVNRSIVECGQGGVCRLIPHRKPSGAEKCGRLPERTKPNCWLREGRARREWVRCPDRERSEIIDKACNGVAEHCSLYGSFL